MKIPHVSTELIEYLEIVYKDQVPRRSDTEREIWTKVGQVEVVKHLRALHEDQVRRALEGRRNA
jgi:hypothetical protein